MWSVAGAEIKLVVTQLNCVVCDQEMIAERHSYLGWSNEVNHEQDNQKKQGHSEELNQKASIFRGPSRWQRSKTRRSPSSPQIHQKYIYMWNSSYKTPTECWQETSDFPKGKKLPTYLGRAKEKRKTETKE